MNRLSFRAKIVMVMLAACGTAVALAYAAFLLYDRSSFRAQLASQLTTEATIVAMNSTAPLSFGDTTVGRETLGTLRAESSVVAARIYTADGVPFVSYETPAGGGLRLPVMGIRGLRSEDGHLVIEMPIELQGERLGTLVLAGSLDGLADRTAHFALTGAAVLGISLLTGVFIAFRLQRSVVGPLSSLTEVARRVSREGDVAVRAPKLSDDEIGVLTDAFNHMLDEIGAQAAALRTAHAELEARVDERTRSLAASESRFRMLSTAAPIGIFLVDAEGRTTYTNPRPDALAGRPADAGDGSWLELAHPEDRALAAELDHEIAAGREAATELRIVVGGVERWVQIRVVPLAEGHIGTALDITARKQTDAERDALHLARVALSRQAGMAEIATGVLHNVGNVLNSVNVSMSLLSDRVRASKVAQVGAVVGLLQEHDRDLPGFFRDHPKGKVLPRYLAQLADVLQAERRELAAETEAVIRNVEHIKKIVSMQQSFARVAGVAEPVDVHELCNDALAMVDASLGKAGVRVVREYEEVGEAIVDKHKVLQILVNLVTNAKHALMSAEGDERRVTVRTRAHDGMIRVEVADNGVGIAAENLVRIFNYGFTTKKSGHGFGLHGSALSAQQLGGELTVHSDGVGQGASFVLTFPARPRGAEKQDHAA
jgi:PAS domain S-box-containing protein